MATLGLMTSWATALFAGWALVAGLAADAPQHPMRRSAERALVASAIAALIATSALVVLLVTGDFSISYVARSITSNLASPYRLAAIWNAPAGAVLPTASAAAFAGWLIARRAPSALATAAVAAVVVALSAASLAATPFATLPWLPTDGLGLRAALQHPLSVVGAVALTVAIAGATARLAATASALALAPERVQVMASREDTSTTSDAVTADPALVLSLASLAVAVWASARGAFETGVAASPSPLASANGALLAALCAIVLAWLARTDGAAPTFAGALGGVGVLSAVLLGALPRSGAPWTVGLFPLVSLVVSAGGALAASWTERAAIARVLRIVATLLVSAAGVGALLLTETSTASLRGALPWALAAGGLLLVAAAGMGRQVRARAAAPFVILPVVGAVAAFALGPSTLSAAAWSALAAGATVLAVARLRARTIAGAQAALVALALAFASIAAAGEGWATGSAATVAGGATVTAATPVGADFELAHQGISRYEDGNAHVEALALEVSRGGQHLALLSADRREYVDSRDELLGPTIRRPGVVSTLLQELRVHVDAVTSDETATLRMSVVPLARGWGAALVAFLLLTVSLLAPRPAPRSVPVSVDTTFA